MSSLVADILVDFACRFDRKLKNTYDHLLFSRSFSCISVSVCPLLLVGGGKQEFIEETKSIQERKYLSNSKLIKQGASE